MDACWANPLGGCGDKLTREHVLSAALWDSQAISVVGFPWCASEPKTIGLGSATSRILCNVHNSGLSELDDAAGKAFRTIQRASERAQLLQKVAKRKPERVRFEIDGPHLERWFLKTALNLSATGRADNVWFLDDSPLDRPGRELVEMAFGQRDFSGSMGLYASGAVGDNILVEEAIEAGPLTNFNNKVVGFVFKFRGFGFLLWLVLDEPPNSMQIRWGRGEKFADRSLVYHLGYINWKSGPYTTQYLHFKWPGQKLPRWIFSR